MEVDKHWWRTGRKINRAIFRVLLYEIVPSKFLRKYIYMFMTRVYHRTAVEQMKTANRK